MSSNASGGMMDEQREEQIRQRVAHYERIIQRVLTEREFVNMGSARPRRPDDADAWGHVDAFCEALDDLAAALTAPEEAMNDG